MRPLLAGAFAASSVSLSSVCVPFAKKGLVNHLSKDPCISQAREYIVMDGNAAGEGDDNVDWNTEDELEVENYPASSSSSLTPPSGDAASGSAEASSSAGTSHSKLFYQFVGMGFSEKLVAKAIDEIGEGQPDAILEHLLTYKVLQVLENSPQEQDIDESAVVKEEVVDSDHFSSDYEGSFLDDLSDEDSYSGSEEVINPSSEDKKLLSLTAMGYPVEGAYIAIERCGPDASVDELIDFICAAQMSKEADALLGPEEKPRLLNDFRKQKKRKHSNCDAWSKKRRGEKKLLHGDEEQIRLPNPMIGFGVPTESSTIVHRTLPEAAIGPPYFYYENVALAPKGVWDTISRFLYDVEPEFVDSKYFCATARKRGYVHNLPTNNRFPLLPLPPRTIHEALPLTRKWWPSWDTRTKLNCLQTCIGSAKLTERIRKALEDNDGESEPPLRIQKYVLDECRKWNLVWVGRNKLAPLEPDEVEMLLGFPKNHTRGGGISRTDRYKSLGNSFQDLFPAGVNLLSLFSGIGGAEVALHRLGIPLKNVVSVEISEVNRNIVRSWWEQTNQKGNLIHIADVQQLNGDRLEQLMNSFGGFDLIVGGSPCNNLAGSNRHSRDGLEGKESSLFYDYFRILDLVKCIMSKGH
ncbi:DNA (cytosine-5)-methyltransferase DRM2 isoform X3 [Rhodamnia argentea]|uniref:DNA (cytosine-5-)-methyltransferase n=1 Tax=Rhodamnia argentea TaxID=178133 RepID=A0ABM3HT42_9MYRT|nr:DNA (cytosine-5)-methyltransferase DRM2 isoform X3 [Rhodamnia argentea]